MHVHEPERLPMSGSPFDARLERGLAIVLFDGVCSLCNAAVDFIVRHDPEGHFAFASLQSDAARAYLARHGRETGEPPGSLVLIDGAGLHERSTAALRIARRLSGAWPLLCLFLMVPTSLRDVVYDVIAANRYAWFGKRESCRVPTPAERARFV